MYFSRYEFIVPTNQFLIPLGRNERTSERASEEDEKTARLKRLLHQLDAHKNINNKGRMFYRSMFRETRQEVRSVSGTHSAVCVQRVCSHYAHR